MHAPDFTPLIASCDFQKGKKRLELKKLLRQLNLLYLPLREEGDRTARLRLQVNAIHGTYRICTRNQTESFEDRLLTLGLSQTEIKKDRLIRQLGKICRYWEVCVNLTSFAKEFPSLAKHIRLQTVVSYRPELWEFGVTGIAPCWVHAEIQLIFHYALNAMRHFFQPRVIGASKSACYLCNLFLSHHGQYFVSKTHGHLYNQWTVPDLASVNYSKQVAFRNVLSAMNEDILNDTSANRNRRTRRSYAGDSWTSFHGRRPPPPLSDTSTIFSYNTSLHRHVDMTPGHPINSVIQEEQSSASEGSNTTLKVEPVRNEKEIETAPKVGISAPTSEQYLEECHGTDGISTPVALHSSPNMVPAGETSPTRSDTARPLADVEPSRKSPTIPSLISSSTSSSTTQELPRPQQDPPIVNQSTTAQSAVPDLMQPVPFRGAVSHTSPLFLECDEVAVDITCEEPVIGHVWATSNEDPCQFTAPVDIELASLKIEEDQVLRRGDKSQELLLQFCNKGKPILGLRLQWI